MELRTERLVLVPNGTKFLESTYKYTSDIENTRFMVFLPNESIEEAEEFLKYVEGEWQKEKPGAFEFAILYQGEHIGSIGVEVNEDRTLAEFGWYLSKKYWNLGLTTEAALAVLDFSVNVVGVKHFIAHCDSENAGSYKVMEKLGMERKDCYGGRKNRLSDEERMELLYELYV